MKRWQKTLLAGTAEIVALLLLHRVFLRCMADHNIASRIFAAGPHVPRWILATATAFLVVRFLTVLALPGMVLTRLALVVMELLSDSGVRKRRRGLPPV